MKKTIDMDMAYPIIQGRVLRYQQAEDLALSGLYRNLEKSTY